MPKNMMVRIEKPIRIRINNSKANLIAGFASLLKSGPMICFDNDEFVVPENALVGLAKKDIKYEVVSGSNGTQA